jgi:hypothetical protein
VNPGLDLLGILAEVTTALDRHRLPYFVTGSFAASVHGEFRATNDVDLVVQLSAEQARALVDELSATFIGDADAAAAAIAAGSSFNLIHVESLLKVDVFPAIGEFNAEAIGRAVPMVLRDGEPPVRFATVEDVLVAKVRWYELGGRESEVQRRDIRGLIRLNRERIDWDHALRMARSAGVELLFREFAQGA